MFSKGTFICWLTFSYHFNEILRVFSKAIFPHVTFPFYWFTHDVRINNIKVQYDKIRRKKTAVLEKEKENRRIKKGERKTPHWKRERKTPYWKREVNERRKNLYSSEMDGHIFRPRFFPIDSELISLANRNRLSMMQMNFWAYMCPWVCTFGMIKYANVPNQP